MKSVCWFTFALLAIAIAPGSTPTEAGWWFHKKHCNTCDKCDKCDKCGCECEKTPCCFLPPLPPRAGVADAIPGRITTVRAERATTTPTASTATTDDFNRRLGAVENEIRGLNAKMDAVTTAISTLK